MKEQQNNSAKDEKLVGSEYDMNEKEYDRCLTAAELSTFVDARGVEKPKSIFVVGQPGARKNRIKKFCNR